MYSRNLISCLLAAACGLVLSGCGKTYTYKYKITISALDHGELKSASGVVSVKEASSGGIALRSQICGEAVPLRLSNGQYLIALLNGLPRDPVPGQFQWRDAPTGVLLHRLGLQTEWSWKDDAGILKLPSERQAFELHSYEMPEFVSIPDVAEPARMQRVNPDALETGLGESVQIKSVTLQVTDEAVTRGRIGELLPWLSIWKERFQGSTRQYKTQQLRSCIWFD